MTSQPKPEPAIALKVGPDRMSVHAGWESSELTADAVVERIAIEAARLGLKLPEDRGDLHDKVEAAVAAGGTAWEVLLLSGTPAVPPVDERIAWERDFFSKGFKVDPGTGRIDYRERAASLSVASEEVLAHVVPGRPGLPGTDVFGKPAPAANMKKAGLRAGRNVNFDGDTRVFAATRGGRLRLSENTLTVDESYEVDGSVGLETGNIKFPGHLVVGDEIDNLAVVEVEGGIEVANVIGAAEVHSGGDILIGRGIAGGGKAHISTRGALQAGYIANAEVRTGADVTVLKEIVQSDVRCRGAVRVEEGRIVGGQLVALGGIVVAELGSEAGVQTLICVGEDYTVETFLARSQEELDRLTETCEDIRSKLKPMASLRGMMTDGRKRTVADLVSRLRTAETRIAEIDAEVKERVSQAEALSCPEVRVLRELHPSVTFRIGAESLTIDRSRTGPLVVRVDESRLIAVLSE